MTLDIYSEPGTKVKVVVNEKGEVWNGWDLDKERVEKYLDKNKIYTVEKINVNNSSSNVYLEEIQDKFPTGVRVYFNSCNLVEVDKIKKWKRYNKASEEIFL